MVGLSKFIVPVIIINANPNVQRIQPGLISLVAPIEHYSDGRQVHILNLQPSRQKTVKETVKKLRSIGNLKGGVKNDKTHASSTLTWV